MDLSNLLDWFARESLADFERDSKHYLVPRQLASAAQKDKDQVYINAVIAENMMMEVEHEWELNPGCRQIHRYPGAP